MLTRLVFLLLFLVYGIKISLAQIEDIRPDFKERLENESILQADEAEKTLDKIGAFGSDLILRFDHETLPLDAPTPKIGEGLQPLTYNPDQKWWWNLVKQGKLDMKDTTVRYPKFIKFCVDVYNWGDRTFNSYDPEYVIGTGKRWKVRLVSDNWLDSYAMRLPQNVNVTMSSDVYANIGAYIQYMAVSVGSSYDVGKLFNKKDPAHKKYEFGFICALFNAELYYHENRGGTNIRGFGKFDDGKRIKEHFPGVQMYTLGFDTYYFFNNKRYSQGAAYNFAKYQLKSQGSFMLGLSITNQRLNIDFTELPEKLKPYLPDSHLTDYYFHYNSYALLFGYGYNWVIAPKLLFNATVMPSLGFSHYYEDSIEGDKYMLSLNVSGRISLTYNLGNYFFGLFGKMNGHWYRKGDYSLFSSIENFSAYVGLRF